MTIAARRVGGYARFSPDDATKISIEMQEALIMTVCDERGWLVVSMRSDPQVSGATPPEERPGLTELLDDGDAGLFDLVMIYEVSRLARDQAMFWTLVERMRTKGVVLTTASLPDVTSDKPEFQLIAGVLQAQASFQRVETKVKTKKALKELNTLGFWVGRTPAGYQLVEAKGGHKELALDKLGRLVFAEYRANPDVKAIMLSRELEMPYMTIWHVLENVKRYGDGSELRKKHAFPQGA